MKYRTGSGSDRIQTALLTRSQTPLLALTLRRLSAVATAPGSVLLLLEKLNGAFMLLRGFASGKGAEVPSLARFRILLPRVESILPRLQFSDHKSFHSDGT